MKKNEKKKNAGFGWVDLFWVAIWSQQQIVNHLLYYALHQLAHRYHHRDGGCEMTEENRKMEKQL